MTPFRANYAFEPTAPGNVGKPDLNVPAADEFAEAIFAAATHAKDALDRAKRKWESETPASRKLRTFAPGDKVLLSTSHLGIKTMAKKLTSKFVGPFEVMPAPNGGFDILSSTWEPIENIPDKFIDAFRKIASVEEEDGFETDEDDE